MLLFYIFESKKRPITDDPIHDRRCVTRREIGLRCTLFISISYLESRIGTLTIKAHIFVIFPETAIPTKDCCHADAPTAGTRIRNSE